MEPHKSSLGCELRIIRVKNIDTTKASDALFVRCYLSAGNNKRVRLESKEISSSKPELIWNQTFSLDCSGSIDYLKRGSMVFELCSRSKTFLGRMNGSKMICRGEIPWKHVLESSKGMEIERWAVMIPENGRVQEDVKLPAVQIAIRIQESLAMMRKNLRMNNDHHRYCGCCSMDGGCKSCLDYEFFAIGAALEEAL